MWVPRSFFYQDIKDNVKIIGFMDPALSKLLVWFFFFFFKFIGKIVTFQFMILVHDIVDSIVILK